MMNHSSSPRYRAVTLRNLERREPWRSLPHELREAVEVVSQVFPFRTNDYVITELIDWRRVPNDPMFQLTFPQRGMLTELDYREIKAAMRRTAPSDEKQHLVRRIHTRLNPHPAGQIDHNAAILGSRRLEGMQHKYRETVLFFPAQGQTCHAYCTFCFRWAQFVDLPELKLASRETQDLVAYLRAHPEVSDLLVTGGDPLVMAAWVLERYLSPILSPELSHLQNIRLGTKALSYWPARFVTDPDADDLLRLFEKIVASGRHLAIMAHYSHPVELSTDLASEAVRRVRSTGAEIRMQSPVIRHINDDAAIWTELWRRGVQLGLVPYYVFIERDTGPRQYFELPILEVFEIFRQAYSRSSGLARTARGPSMSALPGKVRVLGPTRVGEREVLALDYLQARDPALVRRPFFAHLDPTACWFDQLKPAFESDRPFFEARRREDLPGEGDSTPAALP